MSLILRRAAAGDRAAPEELLPLVYAQLRAAAQNAMADERAGHTLSATALVHEAYLRLLGPEARQGDANAAPMFEGGSHFYAAAAEAMRRHLIDHARARLAQKRGGPHAATAPVNLTNTPRSHPREDLRDVADLAMLDDPSRILILDEALSRLEQRDPQAAKVVRLRFFAGLDIERTAEALGVSTATVKRDWQFARAWLFRQVS